MSATPVTINAEPQKTFSASRMKRWMTCPAQAHFIYDLKLPGGYNAKTVFGTVIHHCLDLYNNGLPVEKCVDLFIDLWQDPAPLGYPDHGRWPRMTNYGGLRTRGIDILRVHHQNCHLDKREILGTEHRFLVPFGKHLLTGAVDLLEIRRTGKGKDILRVVDYKTAGRQPNMAELSQDVQFTIYIYASLQREFWVGQPGNTDFPPLKNGEFLWDKYKDMPRRAIWFHLWGQKEIDAGPRTEDDFARLYRLAKQISQSDAAGINIPRIGEACNLCDFTTNCGVHIPTADELRDQDTAWI